MAESPRGLSLKAAKVLSAIDSEPSYGGAFQTKLIRARLTKPPFGLTLNTARRYYHEGLPDLIKGGYVEKLRRGWYVRKPPTAVEWWIRHQRALTGLPGKLLGGEYQLEPPGMPELLHDAKGRPIAKLFLVWRKHGPPFPRRRFTYNALLATANMLKSKEARMAILRADELVPDETIEQAGSLERQLREFVKQSPGFGRHFLRAILEELERVAPVVVSVYPMKSRRSTGRGFVMRPKWSDSTRWTKTQRNAIRKAWQVVHATTESGHDLRKVIQDPRVRPYLVDARGWSYPLIPDLP